FSRDWSSDVCSSDLLVRTPARSPYAVGIAENDLVVAVGPLDSHGHFVALAVFLVGLHKVEGLLMQNITVAVEVLDEGLQARLVLKTVSFARHLVDEMEVQAGVEESHLTETGCDDV